MTDRTCSIDGCAGPHRARGYCASHYNRIRLPDRHKATVVMYCATCGSPIEKRASHGDARRPVCSLRCRHYLRWGRWPEDGKAVVLAGPASRPVREPWAGHVLPPVRRVLVQGSCEWCGDGFTAVNATGGSLSRFCSRRCGSKFHKAKAGDRFRVAPAVRLAIYERDAWVCQLCMEPVDRAADYLDNWAPSLDHIECQSWALVPDHSVSNLRTAHRWCNAVRGDERYYSAADLVA